jgi:HEAT repeat protein
VHLTCLAILTAAVVSGPSAVDGGPAKDARSKVESYLTTHDVPTAAELHALGPAPETSLMAVASDPHAEGLTRARAVAALRLLPSPIIETYLGKLVESKAKATDATDRLIVRRAAVALGWLAGASAPKQLALLFDNDDAEVRLDAVIGLGLARSDVANTILRRQLAVESVARVRDQIERQLRSLAETMPAPAKAPADQKKAPMRSDW